jgi:hypothetical protein
MSELASVETPAVIPQTEGQATEAVKPEPVKPAERESSRFALLAKQERLLVQKKKEIKQQEEQFNQKYNDYQSYEAAKKEARLNPIKALEMLGVSYEDITNFVINGNKPTPELEIKSLREQMEADKKAREEDKKAMLEQEKLKAEQESQKVIEEFNIELKNYITSNSEQYEQIVASGYEDEVCNFVQEYFSKNQKVLSNKEACDMVEEYLVEQSFKLASTKKLSARLKPQVPQEELATQQSSQARTLSNGLTANAGTSMLPAKTEADRMKRAMAALEKR